jgi:nucleotide-binding universal stress UspA family protein
MDHVLCPVDYSQCSQLALRRAVELAKTFDARVTVLHVTALSAPGLMATGYGGYAGFAAGAEDVVRAWQRDESSRLGDFVAPFMDAGVPIETKLIAGVEGNPWREIKGLAEDLPADLIVMGTHGRTGLPHVLLGSVAEKVLRVAPCPVMTVRAGDGLPVTGPLFRRIVCATDLTEASGATVDMAVSLAEESLARLTLVHVVEKPEGTSIDRANQRLLQLARTAPGFCETDERVETGEAWEEIVRVAQATAADLVVIGARARHALGRLSLGSTADQVVRHAAMPVLVVPRKGAATDVRPLFVPAARTPMDAPAPGGR